MDCTSVTAGLDATYCHGKITGIRQLTNPVTQIATGIRLVHLASCKIHTKAA